VALLRARAHRPDENHAVGVPLPPVLEAVDVSEGRAVLDVVDPDKGGRDLGLPSGDTEGAGLCEIMDRWARLKGRRGRTGRSLLLSFPTGHRDRIHAMWQSIFYSL